MPDPGHPLDHLLSPQFTTSRPSNDTLHPQPVRSNSGARAELRERQATERAAEREAADALLESGVYGRVLDEVETGILLKLLTRALEVRPLDLGEPGDVPGDQIANHHTCQTHTERTDEEVLAW